MSGRCLVRRAKHARIYDRASAFRVDGEIGRDRHDRKHASTKEDEQWGEDEEDNELSPFRIDANNARACAVQA